MDKVIAIIPAKGRSRRVPRKNMYMLGGKPLLYYIIEEAKRAAVIDKIYVSTDDQEIADYARSLGAEVPFLRDPALSGDEVHGTEPVLDMLRRLYVKVPESLFCLRLLPPYPFVSSATMNNLAKKSLAERKNVLSVVPLEINEYHLKTLNADGTISPATAKSAINFQIGDAPELFALSGAAQCMPANELLKTGSYQSGTPIGYSISKIEGFELDTPEAFALAEKLLPIFRTGQESL